MRLLTCSFASPSEFLECYSVESGEGALDCLTRSSLDIGQPVLVEVWFPGLPNPTLMRGLVVAVRRGHSARVRIHSGDGYCRDFLVRLARGELEPEDQIERSHRRIPVALPVTCRIEEVDDPATERLVGMTHDVGGGGAWVQSAAPPAVGTRVSIVLGPLHGQTFRLDGRVAWLRRDTWAHGFGIRFDAKQSRDAGRLRAMLRRACETGWVGFGGEAGLGASRSWG
ncbi:MAG TPA: PilZ domain-containing protein [Kofleriaceae bacterium]|nr:PilZ domain-containing protein [Kofleriaceae bacterium]